jgi:hypothetical protein
MKNDVQRRQPATAPGRIIIISSSQHYTLRDAKAIQKGAAESVQRKEKITGSLAPARLAFFIKAFEKGGQKANAKNIIQNNEGAVLHWNLHIITCFTQFFP